MSFNAPIPAQILKRRAESQETVEKAGEILEVSKAIESAPEEMTDEQIADLRNYAEDSRMEFAPIDFIVDQIKQINARLERIEAGTKKLDRRTAEKVRSAMLNFKLSWPASAKTIKDALDDAYGKDWDVF